MGAILKMARVRDLTRAAGTRAICIPQVVLRRLTTARPATLRIEMVTSLPVTPANPAVPRIS